MEKLVEIVGGYRERDKFIRLCQYTARFLAGTGQTKWGVRLATIATELGACRTVLRLFDDIPMLAYTLRYGSGRREENTWLRCLELISNLANQLYYPIEHIAWFANKKLVDRSPEPWGVACTVAWLVSLLTEIFKESTEMPLTLRSQIRALKSQEFDQYLSLIENLADLVNAINWLPAGFLWSAKFSPKFSGGMGMISSAVKLYRLHNAKPKLS